MGTTRFNELGTRVREFRERANLSVDDLANGICYPTLIRQIESGDVEDLPIAFIVKLVDRLQTTPQALLGEKLYLKLQNQLLRHQNQGQTVGERVRHHRRQLKISQTELSRGICSHQTISLLETDKHLPSPNIMNLIAERLQVKLSTLLPDTFHFSNLSFEVELVQIYTNLQDFDRAIFHIEQLQREETLSKDHQIVLLLSHAKCLIKTKNSSKALDLLIPFLEKQEKEKTFDHETMCSAYNLLGTAHHSLRDFPKAFSAYEQGYRISLNLPNFELTSARVTKNLGLLSEQMGLLEDAQRYLEKANTYYEAVSDLKGVADTVYALALVTGDGEKMTRALTLYEGMDLVNEAHRVKQHFAYVIESKRDFQKALADLESSAEAFRACGDDALFVYSLSRASIVCSQNNLFDLAWEHLTYVESCVQKHKEEPSHLIVEFYHAKAVYYLKTAQYEECITASQVASTLCETIGLHTDGAKNRRLTAEAYHLLGRHQEAYQEAQNVISILAKHV